MQLRRLTCLALAVAWASTPAFARNVILFVPDGLRYGIVSAETAPTLQDVRDQGVDFTNSHSISPSFTMPNASAFATGHHPGDTGIFGNTMLMPPSVQSPPGLPSRTGFIENDTVLKQFGGDPHYQGNFVNADTLLSMARRAGFAVAAVGKLGPAGLQDVSLIGEKTLPVDDAILVDDTSGKQNGVALSEDIKAEITAKTGQAAVAPDRGPNGRSGNCEQPGALTSNEMQQRWFTDVMTKVLLPRFKATGKPFFIVFWSREPDGTQHNQGDSFGKVVPGINGPTSLRAIANADDSLRDIRRTLKSLGLDSSTDIIISADHGFSTIAKESKTSGSVIRCAGQDQMLPEGFLAMDLAKALNLPLADPDAGNAPVTPGKPLDQGNGVLGRDPKNPEVVVAANGGSDLVYLPGKNRAALAKRIAAFLMTQDYVSGLFIDDALGKIPGTLPMSRIGWEGNARAVRPAILVNFRSFATDCGREPILCSATITDTGLNQGQGQHGSFSRADTRNFQAAIGPSFKKGYKDLAPTSNVDVGVTIAHLLGLKIDARGKLVGRVLTEALPDGAAVTFEKHTITSPPAANGLATVLNYQTVGNAFYVDAAGFPGRTVGLVP